MYLHQRPPSIDSNTPLSPNFSNMSPSVPRTLDKVHTMSGCWNNNIFYPCTMKIFDNSCVIDKIRVINNVDVDEWKEVVATLLNHNHSNWNIAERSNNKMVLTKTIEEIPFEIVINQSSYTMGELRYEKNGLKMFIDFVLFYKFS
ncbi:hypothetical protein C9374_003045 [Naegleria lovaniensis]|uniref:Uncharacterized protein n=1 Tax=Naegleria lovaniensis TaxID=51637 RepID=A0AA88GU83_NAELO|nr:uncharacterized protein C9374_003045 [Naegleria lovaniensis]KAG2385896.1 hypothetical protein C9374_003045 [Naegleria lovaniensis]